MPSVSVDVQELENRQQEENVQNLVKIPRKDEDLEERIESLGNEIELRDDNEEEKAKFENKVHLVGNLLALPSVPEHENKQQHEKLF